MRVLPMILVSLSWLLVCSAYRFLAVYPYKGKSHFTVLEGLMKGLADKGHQIDVISSFPQKKPYPNYTDIATLPVHLSVLNNVTYEFMLQVLASSNIGKSIATVFGNDICEAHLGNPVIQKLVRDSPKDPPYDAMIMELT
ncbi:hypothetical protein X777_16028 [Ooceraea biroi]|uniref:Ecdysteroid UDP-glucosyltransferase n=1 Tax=Ooceraea biroi TaxID=2015173 RepID=A0A026WVW5_OOCBI|nr:hypothetical protein X777_16028 [Ooceraea biroi]